MFAAEIQRAVEAAPRVKLPEIAALLWRAFGAGQVSETEAEAIEALIAARKASAGPADASAASPARRSGARPRTPESLARRRRWAATGALPPQLAARFTLAEVAVLAVVAAQVSRHSRCTLTLDHLAALAGVCRTSVRNALRAARGLGLVTIEEQRLTAWRNGPNVVRIVSDEWRTWSTRGGGRKSVCGTNTRILEQAAARPSEASQELSGRRMAGSAPQKSGRPRFAQGRGAGAASHAGGS